MESLPLRLGLLLFALSAAGGCQTCTAEARALLAQPEFSTPEACGRTLMASLACDEPRVAYLTLSESLKEAIGATYDFVRLGWPRLKEEIGELALSQAFRLEPMGTTWSEEGATTWWGYAGKRYLGLVTVEQHYFDVEADDREVGAFLDDAPGAYIEMQPGRLTLELEDSSLLGVVPEEIRTLVVGSEWKILRVLKPKEL